MYTHRDTQEMACVTLGTMMDKLHGEMQEYLDFVFQDISEKYGVPLEELQKLYLGDEIPKKAPKKARKVKESSDSDDKAKCSAKTAKGLPCKNKALGGGCFCKVHSKEKDKEKEKPAKKAKESKDESEEDEEDEVKEVEEPAIDIEKMKKELFGSDGEESEEEEDEE